MFNILKASLYKLFRDTTFKVTLIIGVALAVFTNLLYFIIFKVAIDMPELGSTLFSGETALINALNPTSNFGLTVPINLVVFTIGEFTYGTIRNKIIAGHKRSSIYFSLLATGFVFTLILMVAYCVLSWGLGSLLGGLHNDSISGETIGFVILYGFLAYVFIMAVSVFVATLIRSIGGSLPIIILLLVFMGLVPTFTIVGKAFESGDVTLVTYLPSHIAMWIDPLFMLGIYTSSIMNTLLTETENATEMILAGTIVPTFWAVVFSFLGLKLFQYRDIK